MVNAPAKMQLLRAAVSRHQGQMARRLPTGPLSADFDLTGWRVGELTVIRLLDDRYNGSRVWSCRCDCGSVLRRTTGNLAATLRDGRNTSCRQCAWEYRQGYFYERRVLFQERLLEMWEANGDLYGSALVPDHFWEPPSDVELELIGRANASLAPAALPPSNSSPRYAQWDAYLRPILNSTHSCVHCQKRATSGHRCLVCDATICDECVRDEQHRHHHHEVGNEYTLAQIGASLDEPKSRERVRQIQETALCKVRRFFEDKPHTASRNAASNVLQELRRQATHRNYFVVATQPPRYIFFDDTNRDETVDAMATAIRATKDLVAPVDVPIRVYRQLSGRVDSAVNKLRYYVYNLRRPVPHIVDWEPQP